MNPLRKTLFAAAVAGSLFTAAVTPAWASPTSYQATGTVLAVTDSMITIQKGKEKWDIATTTPSDSKVGDKVTVHYTMTASSIDAGKASAPAATAKGKKTDKAPTAKNAPGSTEVEKPASETGAAASPATTPGQ